MPKLSEDIHILLNGIVKKMKENGLNECNTFTEMGRCFEKTILCMLKELKEKLDKEKLNNEQPQSSQS